jgi:tRNA pseudouridine-54 N-methylase
MKPFIFNKNLPNIFTEEDIKDLCSILSQEHKIIYLNKYGERILNIHRNDPRYKIEVGKLWLNHKLKRTLSINKKTNNKIIKV